MFRHSFPVRSAGKLLFPTFPLQSGPRLCRAGTAPLPSEPGASTLAVGSTPVPCPDSIPACLEEDCGTRPSLTGMHCCPSEGAHIQWPCYETILLFNRERNNCSQSPAGSSLLPEAVCLPRPQGWGSAGWGRAA